MKANSLAPPNDPVLHLEALHKAFLAGDIVALFQAVSYAQQEKIETPFWAIQPLEDTLIGVLTKRRGVIGKGNSAFGQLHKNLIRTVRASAFLYVRAWQKDPHRYQDLPIETFDMWCKEPLLWQSYKEAIDAARLASWGTHDTDYRAKASTVRRAANSFPEPIRWGRSEAETKLGLRGPSGIFGPQPERLPSHIQSLLSKRKPKP